MEKKLNNLLLITTTLVIVLFSAGVYYDFLALSWYDEILHFLCGAWGALIIFYLYRKYGSKLPFYSKLKEKPAVFMVLAMLIIGLGWELFELILVQSLKSVYDHSPNLQPNYFDTFTDLIMDMAGAYLVVFKYRLKLLD